MTQPHASDGWWTEAAMRPLAGGYSGETFVVGDGDEQMVLRIYARDPDRAAIDANLLRLVHGIVPVPEVVDQRPATDGKPGVLVTRRLPGQRLDLLIPSLDDSALHRVGTSLGRILARLSGIPMLTFGMFANAELHVSSDGLPADDLPTWAETFRQDGRLAGWPDPDWAALLALLDHAETVLAEAEQPGPERSPRRNVLVHSDFNPKNLLVDSATLEVTGLLDWEFAHAGSPYTDLGNLTRFERAPAFVEAVVSAFLAAAPALHPDVLRLSRCMDLWALVELAGRQRTNAITEMATELLLAQARDADPLAWPWEEQRRPPGVTG